jgi:hypothetical protein
MSRRVYLLGVGIVLVALAFVLTDALLWEPGVTAANVRRVQPGMTLAEVKARLGEQTGFPVEVTGRHNGQRWEKWRPPRLAYVWEGATGSAWVVMDTADRVEITSWQPSAPQPGPLDRLRAWLGW